MNVMLSQNSQQLDCLLTWAASRAGPSTRFKYKYIVTCVDPSMSPSIWLLHEYQYTYQYEYWLMGKGMSTSTSLTWWRHQMETLPALLAICAGNSLVSGEFPAQRPVTRSFDVFFICVRIYGWVNNGEAGDLSRHRVHYDVTVMRSISHILVVCSIPKRNANYMYDFPRTRTIAPTTQCSSKLSL